jgi:L-cysteine:1D-myo-inositol 2-amino-2-deoxy-alpha-D-glucopyranoside ligase
VRDGTVFFSVASDPDYGALSGYSREEMLKLAEERGGHPEDPRKDDPLDFVLWQESAEGEPWWDSPWGRGRPGWHIECSTMATRLIGGRLDIHGGGSDLIYPHHESEIAQAECVPGRGGPFARHWVHTGEVHQDGEKMSKSLGNMTFVSDLLERYEPAAIRRYLLSKHYREDWGFDEDELRRSADPPDWTNLAGYAHDRGAFFSALDDDLNVPGALAVLVTARRAGDEWVPEGERVLGLSGL